MDNDFPISLSQQEALAVSMRLLNRRGVAQQIKRDHRRPLFMDRLALSLGEQLYRRYQPGCRLAEADIAVGWTLVMLELLDKTAATGTAVVERVVEPPPTRRSLFGRAARQPTPQHSPEPEYVAELRHVPTYRSPYTDAAGLHTSSYLERRDFDLIELHRLRVPLELSLGLTPQRESFWTTLRFSPEDHELCRLIVEFLPPDISTASGYSDLCKQVERYDIDAGMTLFGALRRAVDVALPEYLPELAMLLFRAEGLHGGPPW